MKLSVGLSIREHFFFCLNNRRLFYAEQIRKNKLIYQDKPRLKTALELLRTSMDVEDSLSEVL